MLFLKELVQQCRFVCDHLNFRWLKQSGISLGSERKQRTLCKELIGHNLEVELACSSWLRGEMKSDYADISSSLQKSSNSWNKMRCTFVCYSIHLIICSYIWKANSHGVKAWYQWWNLDQAGCWQRRWLFQSELTNCEHSHTKFIHNTCMLSLFEADDTPANCHLALDRFEAEVVAISTIKWK